MFADAVRHYPGEQNREDERYGVDPTDGFDEEQYNIQPVFSRNCNYY